MAAEEGRDRLSQRLPALSSGRTTYEGLEEISDHYTSTYDLPSGEEGGYSPNSSRTRPGTWLGVRTG